MAYGLNFGFRMPMMNFNMMTPMGMGGGNQMDNWQYSYFAGPGKSSISYPVDTLSVQNDMALKSYVDSTYSILPHMQNFYTQMMMKMQEWMQKVNEDIQKRMEEAKERHLREEAERQVEEDDGNIDPTHDADKKKPVDTAPVDETDKTEKTEETDKVDETETTEETEVVEETEDIQDDAHSVDEEEAVPTGDRSHRGTLEDPSTFDENNDTVAKELYDSMKGPGTWTKDFQNAMHRLKSENIVEVMEAYRENYAPHMKEYGFFGTKDFNLIDSILGDFSGEELNKNIKYLGDMLISRAKALTDTKDDCGNVIEDPKVQEFRKKLEEFADASDKDAYKYEFEDFKDWIRKLENTENKRIIMDTNAEKTA